MTFDQIIALAASLGACFSAVATFLTVRQIAKQREASYRPELAFSRIHFEATKDPRLAGSMPTHWTARQPDQSSVIDPTPTLAMPLRNVGLGTARSVRIVWDFDVADTVKRANDLAQRSLTPIYFEFDGAAVGIKSDGGGMGTSMWKNQREALIDYVLPAAVEKEPEPVQLPHAFIALCSAIVHFSFKGDGPKSMAFELPKLSVTLSFMDIAGGEHAAKFELSVHPVGIQGDGTGMFGFVESEKRT